MLVNKYEIGGFIYLCLLWLLCLQLPLATAGKDEERAQALLHGSDDGTLYFEAATDRNITFHLMGEAARLLLNDVDVINVLQRRKQAAAAAARATSRQEPLSLDTLKEEFRSVERNLGRLSTWLSTMRGARRNGLTQRVLRRELQRVQLVGNTLAMLESNLLKDECVSSPCKNGGTCYDAYKSFHCDCAHGWQGTTCEDDVNECFDLASTDLAVCKNDAQCINTPGSYSCVCRNGFSGTHCRLRHNACLSNQSAELCGDHGTCLPSGNDAGYVCICDQGWTWADTNTSVASASSCTRDVDECEPTINPCYNECINLPGSFRCAACPPGYTGDGKFCHDINECEDGNNGGCSQTPTVNCINTEGSFFCGRCPPGWTGDGRTCTESKSNSCNEEICHPTAQCEYISDTVVCSCPAGSFGHGYGADGCTVDANRKPCDNHRCLNNGTCVLSGRGTSCICQPGYTGPLCAEADACHPNPCQNGGECRLLLTNGYRCTCPAGYTGSTCSHIRSYCGLVLRNETGSLQFPPNENGNQIHYQPNERCALIIRSSRGMLLNVTFGMFDLESSNDCSADFLQLHDGSSLTARLIGRFCGHELPLLNGSVITSQEHLFLWFRSDNNTQGRGFNLTWRSEPLVCGGDRNLTLGQSEILRSPSYPGKSRPGVSCRWHLMAPFGTRLLLRFYEITLGNNNMAPANCSNADHLSVFDADRQLYLACQSAQPAPLHTSSNLVHIHFQTDRIRSDSSFQLHYEVVAGHPGCGGIYNQPSGVIVGHINAELCLYLIELPEDTQIELKFQHINLLQSQNCELQKLEIFNGPTDEAPLMRRFCGQPEESQLQPLTSSGNKLLIRYEYALPGLHIAKSFEIRYKRVCNFNFNDRDGGIILSPNYPNGYLEYQVCTFNIQGPLDSYVQINITDLSISANEEYDDETINVSERTNYLDVYLSRNQSDKQRFLKNLTNKLLVSQNNMARLVFHGASNPQKARGLSIKYAFISGALGGVILTPRGHIETVMFYPYYKWIIEAPGRKHFKISLNIFERNSSYIYIYDNSTGTDPKLLSHGDTLALDDNFDTDILTIIVTNNGDIGNYLIIDFDLAPNVCGGNSTARYGTIKSPNWPSHYGASENCTWIIRAPLGHRIELLVHNFTLEKFHDRCFDDYLEIRNGDHVTSPLIGRYCGDSIPPRIPSYGNALHIDFKSDEFVEEKGFYMHWQMMATGCGGKLNSPAGSIHSPHNVLDSRGAVACDWQISVSQGSTVELQLQAENDLCNGQLNIYDGPTIRSAKMPLNCSSSSSSNRRVQMTLRSTSNRVLVRYDVDRTSPEGINFVLDYSTHCKVLLNKMSGAIETPNFPSNYPSDTHCEWDIRAGTGNSHLQLAFSHLSVERIDHNHCNLDYVLLGDYQNDELISEKHLCSAQDLTVTSTGNRLVLRFNSDYTVSAQGFHAEYKRLGCGDELTAPSGKFESSNAPYSVDLDCIWHITVLEGNQIRLQLLDLHIETPQSDCSQDVLTIYAGEIGTSNVLYRSCKVESTTQMLISPANEITVRFQSSSQRARKYVKASYTQIPATCGGHVSTSSGVIASPGFYEEANKVFDKTIECAWTIEIEDSYGINLNFEPFNLTDSPNCQLAQLKLSGIKSDNGEQFIEKACGENRPNVVVVQNPLRLHLTVMAGNWARFALNYRRVCGTALSAPDGYIRSRMDSDCYWTIIAPEGSKVSLTINQLECPVCIGASQGNCTKGLRILNNEDNVMYFNLCQEHLVNLIVPTNKVRIETKGIALVAQYTTIENSCGGNITSVRGTLTSPNYPTSYPANVECIWTIEQRAGTAIELIFEALDITKSEHCNADFLEIRSGLQGSLLGLYCDNVIPAASLIVNANLWIKFRSQPGSSGNGFKLRWNYVHDNEISKGNNGTIESPPTQVVYGDEQAYSWRILAPREMVVVLNFKEYNAGLLLFDGFDDTALVIDIEDSPWQFTSSSNVLYLKTVNSNFDSFRLGWHLVSSDTLKANVTLRSEECDKTYTLEAKSRVILDSPGYPFGYKPNLNCLWVFKAADPTRHVFVDLYEVQLEDIDKCSFDYLSIQSSSNLVDWQEQLRICNSSKSTGTPFQSLHGAPNLSLKLITDGSNNRTGFHSIVRTVCGSNMTGTVGTIIDSLLQSYIDFGESYCEWHIEVRPGRVIDIQIDYNGAPTNASCMHYGLIYDGLDEQAALLDHGKFCNQIGFATKSFRSSGPHVYIKYLTPGIRGRVDNPVENRWNLTYREYRDCVSEVRLTHLASSYNISTPGYPYYPHAHSDCTWLIIAPPGETIAANFVDSFDFSIRHCDEQFVELYDGSTMLATRLLHTCRRPGTIRSSGNLLLVHYQTELTEPHGGFRLNVSLSSCGGQYTTYTGIITSEHYPALGAYPKPAICEYIIESPGYAQLQLNFSDLHLPFDGQESIKKDPESTDRIEILDLMNQRVLLMTLFGNITSKSQLSPVIPTNRIALRFVTVKTVNNYRGFKLQYKPFGVSCYREVTEEYGELEITGLKTPTSWTRSCQWRITVPKGQRVRLEYLNLADFAGVVPTTRYYRQQIFSFYNDPNQRSKITELRLGSTNQNIIESTDNFMLARMIFSSANTRITLRARFSSTEASLCPLDIGNQAVGTLSNQQLTNLTSYYCRIYFVSEPVQTISFNVQEYVSDHKPGVIFMDDVRLLPIQWEPGNVTVSLSSTSGHIRLIRNNNDGLKHFRATYKRYACGGDVNLAEGSTIQLPSLNEHYGQLECVWTLLNSFGYELNGNVSFSDSCEREYLIISNSKTGSQLSKLCRDANKLNTTILEITQCKVFYHTDLYRPGTSQFQLQASQPTSLGGWGNIVLVANVPTPPVVINAKSYRNNMELSWEFLCNENMSLRLEFQNRFFIEMSQNCSHDQLEVLSYKKGLWQSVITLCGRELPQPILIQSHRMRVVFRTNSNITADGFTFIVSSSCDAKLEATGQPQVRRIQKSNVSFAKLRCNFEITTDTKQQIIVNVKYLGNTQYSKHACNYNYFEAYRALSNGSRTTEQLIDSKLCPDFEVSGYERLRLQFVTQMRIPEFELQYQLIGCGGNYTTPFMLRPVVPDTEDTYTNDMNCEWRVQAPPQHAILLRFKYITLGYDNLCDYKYLNIYRGNVASDDQRVARLCGNLTASAIMVDSNQAIISLLSPSYLGTPKFLAEVHFTPNCNERLALSQVNKRMSLVRHYQLNSTTNMDLQCYFRASVPPGHRLSIYIKQLQIISERCPTCNSLEIVDGFEIDSNSLGINYAIRNNGTKHFSSGTDLLIKFSATSPRGDLTFELILEMETTSCGQTEYNLQNTESINLRFNANNISSSYEGSIHCVWKFEGSSDSDVSVKLNSVKLPEISPLTGKCIDYLLFTGSYQTTKYFCGQFNNTSLEVFQNVPFQLTFHGTRRDAGYDFDIQIIKKSICNNTYNALSDTISYYKYTGDIIVCIDEIRVPEMYSLAFDLMYMQFNTNANKSFNIIDLKTNRSVYNTTDDYPSARPLSTTNTVRLLSKGVIYFKLFYYATLKTLPAGCGGELTSLEGQFGSPPYNDHNYSDCSWRITIPAGSSLQFSFIIFDMGSESNCLLDYIEVYDIQPDNNQKLLYNFCGQKAPDPFKTTTNSLKIVAKKSPNFNGIGFRLYYIHV